MRIEENLVDKEIIKVLESENLKFERERKIPEISARVDFFVYTSIPTIIEVMFLSPTYANRKSLLISKLLSIKLINDGNIRLISVFYKKDSKYRNIQNEIIKSPLIKSITDDIIIIKQEIDKDKEFYFSELEIKNLKQALKNEIEEKKIVQKIASFEENKVSYDRVNYTLNNISKFPGRESLIFSFYYFFFENEIKSRLKEIFISNMNNWREFHKNKFDNKYMGNFYSLNNPEDEFKRLFMCKEWDFDDIELQAIILQFKTMVLRSLKYRRRDEYYHFKKSFFNMLLNEIEQVQENFKSKFEYDKILRNNGYNNLIRNFLIYLLNYCLRHSNFKKKLPLKKLVIFDEEVRYYQNIDFNNKIIILKVLDLGRFFESFFSLVYFGKYLKAYFHNDIELLVFLKNSINSGDTLRNTQYTKKKIIYLEENGWKTYPFQNFKENKSILNKIFDEEFFNE